MNPEITPVGSTMEPKMNPKSSPIGSSEDINPIRKPEEGKHPTVPFIIPPPENRNLPCGDLLGDRDAYFKICAPLYKASIRGDWKAAKAILDEYSELDLLGYAINENYDTALHVAASCKSSKAAEKFVEFLVDRMKIEQLELRNQYNNSALSLAIAAGNKRTVQTMLKKNRNLADIPARNEMLPLYLASLVGEPDMVYFIYRCSKSMNPEYWTHKDRSSVFQKCVEADIFDVALRLLDGCPYLCEDNHVLAIMAGKRNAFRRIAPALIWRMIIRPIFAIFDVEVGFSEKPNDALSVLRIVLTHIMTLPKDAIDSIIRGPADGPTVYVQQLLAERSEWRQKEIYSSHVLFIAAQIGNTEFLVELINHYPDLIWKKNDQNYTIFHLAVINRHVDIYNLVHEIGSMKDVITRLKDEAGNNILHLVGRYPQTNLESDSGVGLQMQHELLWFKEVESLLLPSYRNRKNKDGFTPHELFLKGHKDLLNDNEKWMKDTANQCLVVATLIASVAFAAAFGVPGGYDQNTGIPIFLHNRSFIVFAISDAISLATSSFSILIFLSIFTTRYSELEFLAALPIKLMTGLATLFLSITAMLVGFGVSFFTIFQGNLNWLAIIIAILISIPVVSYARLQYNLLGDVYRATFGNKHIFRPQKQRLFYENPRF